MSGQYSICQRTNQDNDVEAHARSYPVFSSSPVDEGKLAPSGVPTLRRQRLAKGQSLDGVARCTAVRYDRLPRRGDAPTLRPGLFDRLCAGRDVSPARSLGHRSRSSAYVAHLLPQLSLRASLSRDCYNARQTEQQHMGGQISSPFHPLHRRSHRVLPPRTITARQDDVDAGDGVAKTRPPRDVRCEERRVSRSSDTAAPRRSASQSMASSFLRPARSRASRGSSDSGGSNVTTDNKMSGKSDTSTLVAVDAAAADKAASPCPPAAPASLPQTSATPAEMDVVVEDDPAWRYSPAPNSQRTFFFPEDGVEFSSEFDSGNLIYVERTGPLRYQLYTAMDCTDAPGQTNNRQWFHFRLRGGPRGATVSVTIVGLIYATMFTYDWMPVAAVLPTRPSYVRLPGRASVVALDEMPPTPGYPGLVYRPVQNTTAAAANAEDDEDGGGEPGTVTLDGAASTAPTTITPTTASAATQAEAVANVIVPSSPQPPRRGRRKEVAMSVSFDFRLETDGPLLEATMTTAREEALPTAMYIACNHPYPYAHLQRQLALWEQQASTPALAPTSSASAGPSPARGALPGEQGWRDGTQIYFHREVLCRSLEQRAVDLLTVTDCHGLSPGCERMPLLYPRACECRAPATAVPYSSAVGQTERPHEFVGKLYVVLSARVHAGECPSSHMMHGCIEFLLDRNDARAQALRRRFVFLLVPMLNPDGVVRGHSRVDGAGTDLNRMYRHPSYQKHPAPYCMRLLLRHLIDRQLLALHVDLHAHANKRGTFMYGNSMCAADMVQSLVFAKLIALNTPYFDFTSCNFSEANMYAVGPSGRGKDGSGRVVVYLETGFAHSYTVETSHVAARATNTIAALPNIAGEELERVAGTASGPNARHDPSTFASTGRAILLALLDMHGANPVSRLALSPYHSVKGLTLWVQRQMQVEAAERLFTQAYKDHWSSSLIADSAQATIDAVLATLAPQEVPEKMTIRKAKLLPSLTFSELPAFVPRDVAVSLLAQTPPAGPPRSLLAVGGAGGLSAVRRATSTHSPVGATPPTLGLASAASLLAPSTIAVARSRSVARQSGDVLVPSKPLTSLEAGLVRPPLRVRTRSSNGSVARQDAEPKTETRQRDDDGDGAVR